jgi:hypothetical protein
MVDGSKGAGAKGVCCAPGSVVSAFRVSFWFLEPDGWGGGMQTVGGGSVFCALFRATSGRCARPFAPARGRLFPPDLPLSLFSSACLDNRRVLCVWGVSGSGGSRLSWKIRIGARWRLLWTSGRATLIAFSSRQLGHVWSGRRRSREQLGLGQRWFRHGTDGTGWDGLSVYLTGRSGHCSAFCAWSRSCRRAGWEGGSFPSSGGLEALCALGTCIGRWERGERLFRGWGRVWQ